MCWLVLVLGGVGIRGHGGFGMDGCGDFGLDQAGMVLVLEWMWVCRWSGVWGK